MVCLGGRMFTTQGIGCRLGAIGRAGLGEDITDVGGHRVEAEVLKASAISRLLLPVARRRSIPTARWDKASAEGGTAEDNGIDTSVAV